MKHLPPSENRKYNCVHKILKPAIKTKNMTFDLFKFSVKIHVLNSMQTKSSDFFDNVNGDSKTAKNTNTDIKTIRINAALDNSISITFWYIDIKIA